MIVSYEMPSEGQFVAVWFIGDAPYSATLRWEYGLLKAYNYSDDSWDYESDHGYSAKVLEELEATYYW